MSPSRRRALLVAISILASGCAASYRRPVSAAPEPASSVLAGHAWAQPASARLDDGETIGETINVTGEALAPRRNFGDILARLPGAAGVQAAAAAQVAQVVPAAVTAKEKLVIEAWIRIQADDVAKTAAAVMTRVEADGGRVVSSNLAGSDKAASSAALELRVPPETAGGFQAWLGTQGVIESRRTLASDVGKLMFDQQLALQNLELTMARLQKLVEKDVPIKELLEIEREMTRVRGEIERVKGEQRWLADRVELATITLTIVREGGPIDPVIRARLYPGPRLAMLYLLDAGDRPSTRIGGGVTLHVNRHFTLDFDVFPQKDGDTRAAIATLGTALYSNYLGGGRRHFLNPYLGLRAGYGYLSGDGSFVVAGEVGIELFKHRFLLVEAAARAVAFLGDNTEGALHATLGASVPF